MSLCLELDRLTGSSREQLIEYLAESGLRVKKLEEELRGAELENHYLRELLRLARIEKYGPVSGKLSEEQLALLELKPGVSQTEVEAESERANSSYRFVKLIRRVAPWATGITRTFATGGKDYPLYTRTVRLCSVRKHKELIGYESSEQLDVEPAKHFVLVTKREMRACRRCEGLGVETAAALPHYPQKPGQ